MKNRRQRHGVPVKPPRPFEFFVISAQNLKNVKTFGRMRAYAVAYVDAHEKVSTRIDDEGETNPTWDEKLTLTVDEDLLQNESAQLTIEIYADGTFRDKLVGTVRVFVADAVKAANGANMFPVVSYLVFTPSGDPQGILNLCIPANGKFPGRLDSSLSFKNTPSINAHTLSFGSKSGRDLNPQSEQHTSDSETKEPLPLSEGRPAKSVRTK